jgi:hypothetical protein
LLPRGQVVVVKILLQFGTKVNNKHKSKPMTLLCAVCENDIELVEKLLEGRECAGVIRCSCCSPAMRTSDGNRE